MTTLQPAFSTQLPEYLLHSDDWYMTPKAYTVLLSFTDDDAIQVLFDENQLSDGAMQFIDRHIDRLFKRDECPDIFSGETIAELKDVIDRELDRLDLSTVIVN